MGAQKEGDNQSLISEYTKQILGGQSEPSTRHPTSQSLNIEECLQLLNSLLNEKKKQALFSRGKMMK